MARALETYRGERRLQWKASKHDVRPDGSPCDRLPWAPGFLRAPHGKLTKTTVERQEREAKKRLEEAEAAFSQWLLRAGEAMLKGWALSRRQVDALAQNKAKVQALLLAKNGTAPAKPAA